ncbi:MAG: hypothetical protein ACK442_04685 [Novosphingobium sp.]|nr:hypothetical protein [Brevundimonas sp.]MCZ8320508.1 hypothetical protein [Novosphingobium sp.]
MIVLIAIFLLGIANFALHRAVLESGHPLLHQAAWFFGTRGLRVSLWVEFAILLGTMLMVEGASGWAWFYAAYSALNAASAWLILSGRV